jgi:hypothetical protein
VIPSPPVPMLAAPGLPTGLSSTSIAGTSPMRRDGSAPSPSRSNCMLASPAALEALPGAPCKPEGVASARDLDLSAVGVPPDAYEGG